jgi:hypothetical protein
MLIPCQKWRELTDKLIGVGDIDEEIKLYHERSAHFKACPICQAYATEHGTNQDGWINRPAAEPNR